MNASSNNTCPTAQATAHNAFNMVYGVLHIPFIILPFFALWFIGKYVRERNTGMKGLDLLERKFREQSLSGTGQTTGSGIGGSFFRNARGTALRFRSSIRRRSIRRATHKASGSKYIFPSDILIEPRSTKMLKLGMNVPYRSKGRGPEVRLAARALEDATACTQKPNTQRLKVRIFLGHLAVALEPFLTLGLVSTMNLMCWSEYKQEMRTTGSVLLLGWDLEWIQSSALNHMMAAVVLVESTQVIPYLTHLCFITEEAVQKKISQTESHVSLHNPDQYTSRFKSFKRNFTTAKYEIMLVPMIKVALNWMRCKKCLPDSTVMVLAVDNSFSCFTFAHICLAVGSVFAITKLNIDAVHYALNEMNKKEPIFRYDPTFFGLQASTKIGVVLVISLLSDSNGKQPYISMMALLIIILLFGGLSFTQYRLVPCYGERRYLNNYRFSGYLFVIFTCATLLACEALRTLALVQLDFLNQLLPAWVLGSAVVVALAWLLSDRRSRNYTLKEFSALRNAEPTSVPQQGNLARVIGVFTQCPVNSYPSLVSAVLFNRMCDALLQSDQSMSCTSIALAAVQFNQLDKEDLNRMANMLRMHLQNRSGSSVTKLYYAKALVLVQLITVYVDLQKKNDDVLLSQISKRQVNSKREWSEASSEACSGISAFLKTPRTKTSEPVKTPRTKTSEPVKTPRTKTSELVKTPRTKTSQLVKTPRTKASELVKTPRTKASELVKTPRTKASVDDSLSTSFNTQSGGTMKLRPIDLSSKVRRNSEEEDGIHTTSSMRSTYASTNLSLKNRNSFRQSHLETEELTEGEPGPSQDPNDSDSSETAVPEKSKRQNFLVKGFQTLSGSNLVNKSARELQKSNKPDKSSLYHSMQQRQSVMDGNALKVSPINKRNRRGKYRVALMNFLETSSKSRRVLPDPSSQKVGIKSRQQDSIERCMAFLTKTLLQDTHFDERFIAADALRCISCLQEGVQTELWNMKRLVPKHFKTDATKATALEALNNAENLINIWNESKYCTAAEFNMGRSLSTILQGSRWSTGKPSPARFSQPVPLSDILTVELAEDIHKCIPLYVSAQYCLFSNIKHTQDTRLHVKAQKNASKLRRDIIANAALAHRGKQASQFNALSVMKATVRRVLTTKTINSIGGNKEINGQIMIAIGRLIQHEKSALLPAIVSEFVRLNSNFPQILSYYLHSNDWLLHDAAFQCATRFGLLYSEVPKEWADFPVKAVVAIRSGMDNMSLYLEKISSKLENDSKGSVVLEENKQVQKCYDNIEDVLQKYFMGATGLQQSVLATRMRNLLESKRENVGTELCDQLLQLLAKVQRLCARL